MCVGDNVQQFGAAGTTLIFCCVNMVILSICRKQMMSKRQS